MNASPQGGSECGCVIKTWKDGAVRVIVFCPLHAAAPDLLAWLRAMVEAHGECMCRPDGIVCPTCRAEEVIARATDERSEEAP